MSDDSETKHEDTVATPYIVSPISELPDEIKPVGSTTKATISEKVVPADKSTVATPAVTSGEAKEIVLIKNYIGVIKANPLYSDTSKILHWKDPVKTGLLFGIFNFFFFLSTWAEYSILTILSYLLLTLLCICFGYSNYVVLRAHWLQGKQVENPFRERFKDTKFHVSRETAEKHLTTVLELFNLTMDNFRDVFYCTDNFLSFRYLAYFYFGATIGNWFSGATLIYLTTLGFFIWPRLYEEKKKEIDHFHSIAMTQLSNYYNLALSKLPPVVTQRFPQLKPKSS